MYDLERHGAGLLMTFYTGVVIIKSAVYDLASSYKYEMRALNKKKV